MAEDLKKLLEEALSELRAVRADLAELKSARQSGGGISATNIRSTGGVNRPGAAAEPSPSEVDPETVVGAGRTVAEPSPSEVDPETVVGKSSRSEADPD